MLVARGRPAGCGAAFSHHGDLGAEVVAVTADGGLLVLCVSAQEPLQHPSAPLTLNLCLDLTERRGQTGCRGELRGYDTQEMRGDRKWDLVT